MVNTLAYGHQFDLIGRRLLNCFLFEITVTLLTLHIIVGFLREILIHMYPILESHMYGMENLSSFMASHVLK